MDIMGEDIYMPIAFPFFLKKKKEKIAFNNFLYSLGWLSSLIVAFHESISGNHKSTHIKFTCDFYNECSKNSGSDVGDCRVMLEANIWIYAIIQEMKGI